MSPETSNPSSPAKKKKSISVDARLFKELKAFKESISTSRRVTWNEAIERLLHMVEDLEDVQAEFERLTKLIEQVAQRPITVTAGNNSFSPGMTPPPGVPPPAYPPPGPPSSRPPPSSGPPLAPQSFGPRGSPPQGAPKPPQGQEQVHEELIAELHQKFKTAKSGLKSAKDAIQRESEDRKKALRVQAEQKLDGLKDAIEDLGLKYDSVLTMVMAVNALDPDKERNDKLVRQSVASVEAILQILQRDHEDLQSEAESLKLGFRQNPELIQAELLQRMDEKIAVDGQDVARKDFITTKRTEVFTKVQDQMATLQKKLQDLGKRE